MNATSASATFIDPVCGMTVEPASAAGRSEYSGETYYFCSTSCKQKFDGHPEQFAGESNGAESNHACCHAGNDAAVDAAQAPREVCEQANTSVRCPQKWRAIRRGIVRRVGWRWNRLRKRQQKKRTCSGGQGNSKSQRDAMKEILFPHQIEAAITGNPFLSLLGDAERKECIAQSSLFTLAKGDTLYRAGDPADCVWAVVNGQAKIVKQSHSGRCLLI